jgi:undecaprenyl phosphate N,N'-diacetylbacillosamine 1-phosphate transferase
VKRQTNFAVKRAFDVGASTLGLVVLAPFFAAVGLVLVLDSPGPVFFRLRTAGRDGHPFDQWKLRTMVKNARELAHPFETFAGDPRITRVGRFLRRWSIDELPQLWNVLRGDMSLVGPRPTFVEVAARYSEAESRRLEVRPGMTGLAQVEGRNLIPWPRRVELDLAYIDQFSPWLDLKILFRTIAVLVRSDGIYGPDGCVRMHPLA